MTSPPNRITTLNPVQTGLYWNGPRESLVFDEESIRESLLNGDDACFFIEGEAGIGATNQGNLSSDAQGEKLIGYCPPLVPENLGDSGFKSDHHTRYAYYAGSMAHGISSAEMVIALGKKGVLASFGAGGVLPAVLESTIAQIKKELPEGPYAFNLIHNPYIEALERASVELYLKNSITTVEASAYMELTPYVVHYRAAGLSEAEDGSICVKNKIIAKVSRREVAAKFMEPAPEKLLAKLVETGAITRDQANMAKRVPMADDITVEADSGGHTDNRPLVSLLPSIIALRNEIQTKNNYSKAIRIGAAGGIGTPEAALAAFMMGAAYIVTGSVNQSCIEAGTSDQVRNVLSQAQMADVIMAPAFDMFEMGGRLQVLKRGTLFAMRAQKLADFYRVCTCIDDIPADEKAKLEKQVFRKSIDDIWAGTVDYFNERDPEQIKKAEANPKKKMALIFRWYMGLASHWANAGEKGREMDYQIWCGPSMGAFNDWVRGSFLEKTENRRVATVALNIMKGVAYLNRLQQLKFAGLSFPAEFEHVYPTEM